MEKNSSYGAPADAQIDKQNWPTITKIIKRERAAMVCKSLNDFAPMYLSRIFSRNSTQGTFYLRNSETLT